MRNAAWRLGIGTALLTGLGVFGLAGPASAHVTVSPGEATAGERARVEFRVPTESDTESTTALAVHFPEEPPIASVSVGTVPGWRVEVGYRDLAEPVDDGHGGQVTEAVEAITWTAEGAGAAIGPGQFAEFPVAFGPLPEVESLSFPALQTYSDGEVVRWIELPEDGAELARPAPTLTLAPVGAPAAEPDTEPVATAPEPVADPEPDRTGTWLGLAGLLAGLAALALAGFALARSRATAPAVPAAEPERVGTARAARVR